jgi:mevalonate kinase
MAREFYSNGKLLITGEYAVLDGAKAWAIPTKYGQSLIVIETESKNIEWTSLDDKGRVWFEAKYDLESMTEISSSNSEISKTLHKTLIETQKLNPHFLADGLGYTIESKLTFPKDWGLGSSSTLINNIAQWANINPYQLLENTFGGSGYDIACAQHNTPIIYQLENRKPSVEEVNFNPDFTDQLFFIHLNKKQNSREGISQYRQLNFSTEELVNSIGDITSKMASCHDLVTFETLMDQHETILSKTLKTPTVKKSLFDEYTGSIKSLGAWGGDFILVTGDKASMAYFKQKGYSTIIPYSEMIL